jgi:C4-type Zn-finger protein
MDPSKECPMCAETMRLETRELVTHIPGTGETTAQITREWVCPECDYFEEAENDREWE